MGKNIFIIVGWVVLSSISPPTSAGIFLTPINHPTCLLPLEMVSGKVTDIDSGDPIPGTQVVIKGTSIETVTNVYGEYSLEVPLNATIVFSGVGLETMEIQFEGKTNIDVAMKLTELDEIVFTCVCFERQKYDECLPELDDLHQENSEDEKAMSPFVFAVGNNIPTFYLDKENLHFFLLFSKLSFQLQKE